VEIRAIRGFIPAFSPDNFDFVLFFSPAFFIPVKSGSCNGNKGALLIRYNYAYCSLLATIYFDRSFRFFKKPSIIQEVFVMSKCQSNKSSQKDGGAPRFSSFRELANYLRNAAFEEEDARNARQRIETDGPGEQNPRKFGSFRELSEHLKREAYRETELPFA
jgi:hypothetical protein